MRIAIGMMVLLGGAPAWAQQIHFRKHQVDPVFFSEGVAVGDVDRDGLLDIFAGDVWYATRSQGVWQRHELRPPIAVYDGSKGYSNSFANFAHDVNQDGWVDLVVVGFPGREFHWYENPQGRPGHWKEHPIWRSACNETPIFADLLGDGRPGVLLGYQPEGQMGFFRPGPDPSRPWEPLEISQPKSPGTVPFWHGLGVGDVNQDKRADVLINVGWWEQPADATKTPWPFHPLVLDPPPKSPPDPVRQDRACADIHVYDVDGDGDPDILSSSAHKYGVWWFEQVAGSSGPTFLPHTIRDDVSQSHALVLADVNGDGVKDLVTGKRFYAHQGKDPGAKEPAVLYWIEIQRGKGAGGKPRFVNHPIDDDSGLGTQFVVTDFDGDGLLDIVTSNKKGTHVFCQQRPLPAAQ